MHYSHLTALLVCATCLSSAVRAQDDQELEMEIFFAPAETVTSAVRHAQPLELSPSAVTVLTQEDIQASGARTLPEILRLVPNMDVAMINPLWHVIGNRGRTDLTSDRLLLLVNGRDVTNEFFGFPFWSVQSFSMDEVERIEVIRGPGSALYGANAYAGVVHVITRPPGTGPRASVSIRGGERGRTELAARGTQSIGPVSVGVAAGIEREDHWTGRDVTAKRVLRARLDGNIRLGTDRSLALEAGVHQTGGSFYSTMGNVDLRDILAGYARARLDFDLLMVQATYERMRFSADMGMRLHYPELDLLLAELPRLDGYEEKVAAQAQHAIELPVRSNRITYGADYVLTHFNSPILLDPDYFQPEPDHYEHRLGLFVQDELDLSALLREAAGAEIPPTVLTAGLRFDHNSVSDWELSPRASVVFAPTSSHSFRLGYAHAFLKPAFFQSSLCMPLLDVSNLGLEHLSLANTDLRNQKIDSLEFGYTGRFLDEKLILRCDFAYNWYRNSIWWQYDPAAMEYKEMGGFLIPDINGPGFGFVNEPEGENGHDLELQAILRPTERTRVFLQAGYRQLIRNATGEYLWYEPALRLAAGGDLSTAGGFSLSLRAFYTGDHRRVLSDPSSVLKPKRLLRVPDYWLLNFRVAWNLPVKPLKLAVGLEGFNLLDFRSREHPGLTLPNGPDYGGERLGRRIVLFVHGQL
jgi:outer membrane receptor protein involved in Fe transport